MVNNASRRSRSRSQAQSAGQSRELVILGVFLAAVIILLLALLFRTVIDGSNRASQAADQYSSTGTSIDVAERGTIYDRNGEVLASSVESATINVNPTQIGYAPAVSDEEKASLEDPAKAVATILYNNLGETYEKTYDEYYEMVTRQNTAYVIICRRCDKDVSQKIKDELSEQQLEGVFFDRDSTRVYPNGNIGSQVIGTVGLKMIDSKGDVVADEEVSDRADLTESYRGTSGLELQYDSLLAGVNGQIMQEKGATGIPIAGGAIVMNKATDGEDIVTSIDIKLQHKAETSLKSAVKKYKAKGGSVTVLDASTGEVYASASLSRDKKAKSGYSFDVGKLWSVSDTYEPGSTFKSFTAASVLINSKTTPQTVFSVPAKLKVYNHTVTDSHARSGTENMTLDTIIADSSNIGTVLASRKVKPNQLYKTYQKFGFGQDCGVDFPGAASGLLEETSDWDGVQEATISFGQGVSVTGMQLVRAYGAIEQNGIMHVPHFLTALPNNKEKSEELTEPFSKIKKTVSASTCEDLTTMLKSVVTKGTAKAAAIKGFDVVGKTGTAEIPSNTGGYLSGTYIVSFCGWLDNTDSDLVCLVTLERPQTEEGGGPVCGPVFADIMSFAANRYQISAKGN